MNTLLIYPRFPITYWGFQHGLHLIGKQSTLPPLGLITVAAQLPRAWPVRLVDLNVRPVSDDELRWAEVVLTGGLLIQEDSTHAIIDQAHAHGLPVAVGGPAATTSPELFTDADVVFRGEIEGRVEALLSALARCRHHHQVLAAPETFPEMRTVPTPRFDLLDLPRYASMSVQYSRGCPFHCEFCDIVAIFGRHPRVKTPLQVLTELETLYGLGYRGTVFFVDDNFIGNKPEVRRLLPFLQAWQRSHGHPFELYTEASVDLASDPQLLRAMVEAGFTSVFVGIETPSTRALEETRKLQNLKLDLSLAIDRLTAAGLEVMGGFIVGFDSDGEEVFAEQRAFLARQPIPLAMVGLLTALPGTELFRRLDAEQRLRRRSNGDPFSRPNYVPVMEEQALLRGYAELLAWLYDPEVFYARCEAYLDRVGARPPGRSIGHGEVAALLRTTWHVGVKSPHRRLFWRLLGRAARRGREQLRQAVVHAVQGEHLIRYTQEHVVPRMAQALEEARSEAGPGRAGLRDLLPTIAAAPYPGAAGRRHRASGETAPPPRAVAE